MVGAAALFPATSHRFLGWAVIAGIVSDILDGIIARLLGVSNPDLRITDGRVDRIFWLAVLGSAMLSRPEAFNQHLPVIATLISLELAGVAASLLKFGRRIGIHAVITKFWGLSLVVAFADFFFAGGNPTPFLVALALGVVTLLDTLAILLLLPVPHTDVPSCYHAWRIRRGLPFKRRVLFNG
jgi:CDP-diacylglycerol--glycerol-3-phosphate 3-phosphatidyltransferase